MLLSKYCDCLKIKKDVYAIYNRFLFNPIFINEKEKEKILKEDFDAMDKKEINHLKERGISLIYIIGNNNCNMACKYCFIGELNNRKPIFMSEDILSIALDKFQLHIEHKGLEKGIIVFYGGEPLLNYPLIQYAVEYIKKNNYKMQISLVTNGLLLDENKAKFIKENNIGIGISIDGPKKYNDKKRVIYNSNKGTYDNVIEKIKLFQRLKVPFGLSITLNDYALENQDLYLEWIKNLNVKEITYNLMHFNSSSNKWQSYYKEIANFLFKSNNYLKDYNVIEGRINRKYDAFYKREFKYSDCGAVGTNQISIKPNGDITICHGLWNTNQTLGNIKDINFDEIFDTEMYKKWNKNITLNRKKCINCAYIYMCGGGCPMESKNMFGNINNLDVPFCLFTKKITKLILKEYYELSKSK